ncbi:uncharacterized protein [Diabrotica undecimpunctata]|uniref:uncharacterized protein n=1 Tax=Diabrotica undecimpunctata TaxID=50387 RepID=UPI003B636CF6
MNPKDQPGIRILQVNVGRARRAHDLIYAKACKLNIDLLIVPEPNKKITTGGGWIQDEGKNVAVLIKNRDVGVQSIVRGGNHLLIRLRDFSLLACYVSPNIPMMRYETIVNEIMGAAINEKKILIAGDINAKSRQWGSPINDKKGELWNEWIAQAGLQVLNNNKPTFIRGASQSHIDITFASEGLSRNVYGWDVLDDQLFTYHRYIQFEVKVKGGIKRSIGTAKSYFNKNKYLSEVRKINEDEISDLGQLTADEQLYKMRQNWLPRRRNMEKNPPIGGQMR